MIKMVTLIALPLSIIFGPISILVALILPKRKLCLNCYKAIHEGDMLCTYCGKSQIANSAEETITPNPKERFSKEAQAAVAQGVKKVNLPTRLLQHIDNRITKQ